MTTIPEKYARIILTAVKMGDTGSVPLEQLVAENIERAIEEHDEIRMEYYKKWLNGYRYIQSKEAQSNTADANDRTPPEYFRV